MVGLHRLELWTLCV